jgi:hypothetical protein
MAVFPPLVFHARGAQYDIHSLTNCSTCHR